MKSLDGKTTPSGGGSLPAVKKEGSQWCDVGIMKGTTCVVSYYHLTSDVATGNGEVSSLCDLEQLVCALAGSVWDWNSDWSLG